MKCKFHLLVAALALSFGASAQNSLSPSVLASSGNSSKGDNIRLDWTLGEVAVATRFTPSGLLTEGFHQPEILRVEPVSPEVSGKPITTAIAIAPNPASTLLTIQIPEDWHRSASFLTLFDLNGQQVWAGQIPSGLATSELNLGPYPAGTYWLRMTGEASGTTQTFKVIKI